MLKDPPARPERDLDEDLARFREYRSDSNRKLRNDLISSHHGLAVSLARRFAHRGEPLDDLVQVAQFGLLKAVERFDPDRGISFSSFAVPTITGELKRHFRDHTWVVKVPRSAKELYLRLGAVTDDLTERLGRSVTLSELAAALDVSIDDVVVAMEARSAYRPASLATQERSTDGDRESRVAREPGEIDQGAAELEARLTVEALLATLPERERTIVQLRFFDELTQSEIAERLGISQMHVSRLLRQTLGALGGRLHEPEDLEPGDGAGGPGRE